MNPGTKSRLLLGAIMAVALLSYVTITANASRSAQVVIYEMEASQMANGMWAAAKPFDASAERKLMRKRRAMF